MTQDISALQTAVCARAAASPSLLEPTDRICIGRDFNPLRFPINGLRHPTHGNVCGWYIWSGESLSDDPDYFEVHCYEHLVAADWPWIQYLALPAGWRFLAAPGYEDMWFDAALLDP